MEKFSEVGHMSNLLKVESSQSFPVALFGGYRTLDGASLVTNNEGDFNQLLVPSGKYINDLRGVHELTTSGYSNELMWVTEVLSGEGYGIIKKVDMDTLSGYSDEYVAPSGVRHIETSNYYDQQFVFLSTTDTFYQKDGTDMEGSELFVERNTDLPNSLITCIRLDDKI